MKISSSIMAAISSTAATLPTAIPAIAPVLRESLLFETPVGTPLEVEVELKLKLKLEPEFVLVAGGEVALLVVLDGDPVVVARNNSVGFNGVTFFPVHFI